METAAHNLQVAPPLRPVRNLETERLCDEFYERASDALERLHPPVMMNLEETNGFLTALACESSFADPEDYIDVIAGEDFVDSSSDEAYAEFTDLLSGQMDLIRRVLANNEVFFPVLLPDENGQLKGNDWAQGFARALAGSGLWDRLMDDKDHWQLLSPMLVLDTERHPLADEPPKAPITSEQRDELLSFISVSVMKIYKYFEPDRIKEVAEAEKVSATLPAIDPSERSDLARIDELLARLKPAGALDLEALDGFVTALTCGPAIIDIAEAIAPIFGDAQKGAFPESELREICDYIISRYNEIGKSLDDGRPLQLIVRNDSSPKLYAEEWVHGFTFAMGIDAEGWKIFVKSKDYSKALMPMFLLDPQVQQFCSPTAITDGELEKLRDPFERRVLLSAIPACVAVMDDFFGPDRLAWDEDPEPPIPIRRTAPKQGRNDPCACGSGKKYKRCCGV